jgi:hypothetical protein
MIGPRWGPDGSEPRPNSKRHSNDPDPEGPGSLAVLGPIHLEVFEAVRSIAREGGVPTRRAVSERLRQPGVTREPAVCEAWREARAELAAS